MVRDSEVDAPSAPLFTSRRERRAAERAAEAGSPELAPTTEPVVQTAVDPGMQPAPESTFDATFGSMLTRPVDVPATEHLAPRQPRSVPAAARRRRRAARGLLSVGAAAFAIALGVGMSLPANVFGSAAPVVASDLTAASAGDAEAKQALAVSDTIVAAEAPAERDGYASESFADAERARYQASGQGFAPGFVPTAGAIRWPFDHSVPLTSGFGYSDSYGGYHSGIDFIPGAGAPIGAIADGVVTWVGWDGTGYGYYAKIQFEHNGSTMVAIYAHMIDGSSEMYPGQLIKAGDQVGLTGDTGIAYGAHLHLGLEQDGTLIDPFAWLTANATNNAAPTP